MQYTNYVKSLKQIDPDDGCTYSIYRVRKVSNTRKTSDGRLLEHTVLVGMYNERDSDKYTIFVINPEFRIGEYKLIYTPYELIVTGENKAKYNFNMVFSEVCESDIDSKFFEYPLLTSSGVMNYFLDEEKCNKIMNVVRQMKLLVKED